MSVTVLYRTAASAAGGRYGLARSQDATRNNIDVGRTVA